MRITILLFSAALFWSCEKTVLLDLEQTPPKVVIEAQLTDRPAMQFVKVTWSAGFYDTGETPRITDATVAMEDNLGNIYSFVHNPNAHPDSAGIYIPQIPFQGTIGRVYNLTVTVGGETFEAEDELFSVIPMDSLKVQVNENESEDPKDPGRIYELLMYAREPQDQKNFYLFKFYRNDTLTFYNDTDIYYSDDELLAEKIDGVPSPVYYALDDVGRVEVYSLSRVGFVYYNDLFSLLNNDAGGMFGSIPSSPRTNISNGALGFFQVSAVNSSEILVE